jgi:hypothetical protein
MRARVRCLRTRCGTHRTLTSGCVDAVRCFTMHRIIFAYGILLYKLDGTSATSNFTKTWGIAYAIDQAKEWYQLAAKVALIALFFLGLDQARATKNTNYLEDYLDVVTVQATMYAAQGAAWWPRVQQHVRHFAQIGK